MLSSVLGDEVTGVVMVVEVVASVGAVVAGDVVVATGVSLLTGAGASAFPPLDYNVYLNI